MYDLVLKEGMWHEIAFSEGNDVVLSSRWQFQDGRSKGMGTEWDQEVAIALILGMRDR